MQDRIVKRFFFGFFFYVVFHSRQSAAVGVFCYFANFQVQCGTTLTRSQMGQKNLVLLTGSPYYRGRLKFHDFRAIMTNTPYSAFAYFEQLFSLQPRPQGFSLKKWVGREKALASAGHVHSLNIP